MPALMARLAALVPKPRMHLTRYHGVSAPHSQYRAAVTPAQRGRGAATPPVSGADPTKPSTPRQVAMSWARRLKRVFGVEIESCARCGGELSIIGAVCTPDFFGFDATLRLRYRGRLDASGKEAAPDGTRRELYEAMRQIAATGAGPAEQNAGIGCSIKWRVDTADELG